MTSQPVSVVVPTLGRPSLDACLRSIAGCRPAAAEIVVVVQFRHLEVARLVADGGLTNVRVVSDPGSGVASSTNLGIRHAAHQAVAVTHDDCTVAHDWVGTAGQLSRAYPAAVLTGRVLPVGDPERVPSCKADPVSRDFTGALDPGALYPADMVLPRDRFMSFGGFDERFGPATTAEDCDFAYRWLKAGCSLRYEPSLVVHHHDWRTTKELSRLYFRYGIGLGAMYGKHLRAGDRAVLRFLVRDLRALDAALRARRHGPSQQFTDRLHFSAGLPKGLVDGLRRFGPVTPGALDAIG